MNTKQLFVFGASMLAAALGSGAVAQQADGQYVQVAEIEIDAAIRKEPGVLVLYAVAEKDNPTRVKVFEIYRDRDAYEAHLASDNFKKYKTTTEKMVKSLKLVQTTPIMLGAKSR
jgi:quinol monooxygenase YgiN